MAGLALSQAIGEYLAWLELDRHASTGTVAGYRGDLRRFSDFAGGDVGIPDIAELDRDILRGYQRHLARARTGPEGRTAAVGHLHSIAPIGGVAQLPALRRPRTMATR